MLISCRLARQVVAGPCLLLSLQASIALAALADWEVFSGPGFAVDHPAGWQVETDAAQGSIVVAGPADERVVLWPIFVRTSLHAELAEKIARQLAVRSSPAFSWRHEASKGAAVRLIGHAESGQVAVASLTWVNSRVGSAACFTCCSAPATTYSAAEETFAAVLNSLRLHGPIDERPEAPIEFVRWRDPHEDAFEVDIPKDWQVRGGLSRFAALDTRPAVEVQSPEGRVLVYFGDANTPQHIVPSTALDQAGFVEGSWYSPGQGVRMQVKQAMNGGQFARWFTASHLVKGRVDLRFDAVRSRPDVDRLLDAIYGRWGSPDANLTLNAGEALYACRDDEGPLVGYSFAATRETPSPRGYNNHWKVEYNFGYLAAHERAEEAEAVLLRLVASFRLDPAWVARQKHLAEHAAQVAADSGEHVAGMIFETRAVKSVARIEQPPAAPHVILEIEGTGNPSSAQVSDVESGQPYDWIDSRGNIIGTETYSVPNINGRELVRLP